MSLYKWLISFLLIIVVILHFSVVQVAAQRGCCSWHGGISHCASNGRYVCNDGTYSPSCTCGSTYRYTAPAPSLPTIPSNTNGTWEYVENSDKGVDLHFDWDRPDGRGYSITINKTAGANPGPLADTTKSEYIFKNVSPGTWYINLKEMIDGQWSRVSYWEITIPENIRQQAKPFYTPTVSSPIPSNSPKQREDEKADEGLGELLTGLGIAVGIPSLIAYIGKSKR